MPPIVRSTSLIDFIDSLIEAVDVRSNEFQTLDTDSKKRARFSPQLIVFRAALNDLFSVTSAPFILVETTDEIQRQFMYNEAENTPLYVYNDDVNYLYNGAEITTTSNRLFTVSIPTSIHTAELERQVRNEADKIKLAGTNYDITTY